MLIPLQGQHTVDTCSLEIAIDDNMPPGVMIWDRGRDALYIRPSADAPHWVNIETGVAYTKRRDADGWYTVAEV